MAKAKISSERERREPGGYPYNPLASCIKLGAAVKDGGGKDVPKAVIAETMGTGDTNPSFAQLVASAKCFGIVEGIRTLSLTEAGRDYFFPVTDASARLAQLSFFGTPHVYQLLIEKFDGAKLPPTSFLTNLLRRVANIPESWISRAASLFVSSAQELGIIDDAGFLRYRAALHTAGRNTASAVEQTAVPQQTGPRPGAMPSDAVVVSPIGAVATSSPLPPGGVNVWTWAEGGGTVRVEITHPPLPRELWARLRGYVDLLEPPTTADDTPTGGP